MAPVKLAGRCVCGVSDELVARDPDAHLPCLGLRWCGRCGEAAEYRADCAPCKRERTRRKTEAARASHAAYMRAWLSVPSNRAAQRESAKLSERRSRRQGTARYERQKARKRERYATDAAYAEAKRARARRRAA